jgi:hypothetical protein
MHSRPLFMPRAPRRLARMLTCLAVTACASVPALAEKHQPPPAKAAIAYPAVDDHPKEQVAIAAVPCLRRDDCSFFRIDYWNYGFLPIRIIVTNLSDRPISLSDARILFVDSAGDRIQAAEPQDVERRVSMRDKRGASVPVGPFHVHTPPRASDKAIESEFDEFEYAALAVEPHTTRAGYLFYDIDGLGPDPLHGASLTLSRIHNADGQDLFFFQIPFDKFLATQH